ncbi:hypothetical protein Neosp_004229 [[Neocosmospora] mangrovei]
MLGETGTNPIRRFISFKDQEACKILNKILFEVGKRDLKIQGGLKPKERLKLTQMKFDQAAAMEFGRRKIAEAIKQKRLQGLDSQVKAYDFFYGQTAIKVALSDAKMAAASGKRASQLTQAAVMGGFSASEWLHLAAFSWGGFMSPDEKSGFSTSQNLENLVFGTSETNSLMTSEDPNSRFIRCDVYTHDNKYKFEDITIDKSLVEEVLRKAEENIKNDPPQTMSDLIDDEIESQLASKKLHDSNNAGRRSTLFDQGRGEEMGQQQKKPKQKKNDVFNIIKYGGLFKPYPETNKTAVEDGNQD